MKESTSGYYRGYWLRGGLLTQMITLSTARWHTGTFHHSELWMKFAVHVARRALVFTGSIWMHLIPELHNGTLTPDYGDSPLQTSTPAYQTIHIRPSTLNAITRGRPTGLIDIIADIYIIEQFPPIPLHHSRHRPYLNEVRKGRAFQVARP